MHNVAMTSRDATDPRLTGRIYDIPFEDVWRAALALASGGLSRWALTSADDQNGLIQAEASTLIIGNVGDVTVRIGLDPDARTRVDMRSTSRSAGKDWGANVRRIERFLHALDDRLARPTPRPPIYSPEQRPAVDPTKP
jgi:hypothetical protein